MFGITDIKLRRSEDAQIYDINFVDGDFEQMNGLDTAILMSLTCERRADESEVSLPEKRRGWIGNEINGFSDFEYGSKLWLLEQARATQDTLNKAVTYAQEALQWLVEDDYATSIVVDGEYDDNIELLLNIKFVRNNNVVESRTFNVWQNTFIDGI
jgi:phage gp46-like protein